MKTEEDIKKILENGIILITFGKGKDQKLSKARIRPLILNQTTAYQMEKIIDSKAYHENISGEDLFIYFYNNITEEFKNAVIYTTQYDYYIRRTKKGSLSIMKHNPTKAGKGAGDHNIQKKYIIPEGEPTPFLLELGIMNAEGQVYKAHYSKFRQINRFLELVNDESKIFGGRSENGDRPEIRIYDLCCGKGYLTLALHYYFTRIRNQSVFIVGMDLKNDVIENLNNIVNKLNLKGINFIYGDISDAQLIKPDLVVALHACDTATDIALEAAVKSEARLIMAVPCCQHELFNQIKNEDLSPILKYGIMKDKFTELSTNALRGLALEARGYQVKMIEFTSIEHTMKNILIKAEKLKDGNPSAVKEFKRLSTMLNVSASAQRILSVK